MNGFATKLIDRLLQVKLDDSLPGLELDVFRYGRNAPYKVVIRKVGTNRKEACRFWGVIELLVDGKPVALLPMLGSLVDEEGIFVKQSDDLEFLEKNAREPTPSGQKIPVRWICVLSRYGFVFRFNGTLRMSADPPPLHRCLYVARRWHMRMVVYYVFICLLCMFLFYGTSVIFKTIW